MTSQPLQTDPNNLVAVNALAQRLTDPKQVRQALVDHQNNSMGGKNSVFSIVFMSRLNQLMEEDNKKKAAAMAASAGIPAANPTGANRPPILNQMMQARVGQTGLPPQAAPQVMEHIENQPEPIPPETNPRGYAAGGIVSFAEGTRGGTLGSGYYGMDLNTPVRTPVPRYVPPAEEPVPIEYVTEFKRLPEYGRAFRERLGSAIDTLRTPAPISALFPSNIPVYDPTAKLPTAARRAPVMPPNYDAADRAATAAAPAAATQNTELLPVGHTGGGGGASAGIRGVVGGPGVTIPPPVDYEAMYKKLGDRPDTVAEMKKFTDALGDNPTQANLERRMAKMDEEARLRGERSPGMGLLHAGLSMAKSASTPGTGMNPLGHLVTGATEGLKSYTTEQEALRKSEEERAALAAKIGQGPRAERLAALQRATQLQDADTAARRGLMGAQIQGQTAERNTALTNQTHITTAEIAASAQLRASAAASNKPLEMILSLANTKIDEANRVGKPILKSEAIEWATNMVKGNPMGIASLRNDTAQAKLQLDALKKQYTDQMLDSRSPAGAANLALQQAIIRSLGEPGTPQLGYVTAPPPNAQFAPR